MTSPGQIWLANSNGSNPQQVAEGAVAYVFSWSPNGAYLVYTGESSDGSGTPSLSGVLWIMDPNGQNRRPILSPFIFGWGFKPVWSPDSRWLALTGLDAGQNFGCIQKQSQPNPETCVFEGTAIYIENILTGEMRRLASGIDPTWSPDGSMVAFASRQSGIAELWVINVDGTELRQLTNQGEPIRYPIWLER